MQRKNIPTYVLARGVSKKGFEQLLANIKKATIEEGLNKINEYQEMIDAVKAKDEDTDQWVSDFMMQLEESNRVIKENVSKIEALFETIFVDWEKYKEENGIVEEVAEEKINEKTEEDNKKSEKKDKKSKKKKSEVAEGDKDE